MRFVSEKISGQSQTVITYIALRMKDVALTSNYAFIERLVSVITGYMNQNEHDENTVSELLRRPEPGDCSFGQNNTHFLIVDIHPLKLIGTVRFDVKEHDQSSDVTNVNWLFTYMKKLHLRTSSIYHVPLNFDGITVYHPLLTTKTLSYRLIGHYTHCLYDSLPKIVGSWSVVGEPVGIASKVMEKNPLILSPRAYSVFPEALNLDDVSMFAMSAFSVPGKEIYKFKLSNYLQIATVTVVDNDSNSITSSSSSSRIR
jgi:hypothetical protein